MGNKTIALLAILSIVLGTGIGFGLSYILLRQNAPYVHSQLLAYPPTAISANSYDSRWVLEWTPLTDVRIMKVQVWMGNPANAVWEGDTYITLGKPSDPSNSKDYTDTIQLIAHYQFDSHAASSMPHQLMIDLAPGFKVPAAQPVSVYRFFNNFENRTVTAGDVQVIIYYENA